MYKRIMNINPELGRNLLLSISPGKLISAPVTAAGLLYLFYLLDKDSLASDASGVAIFFFFLITSLWGSVLASQSIVDEFNSHTWDFQKLTPTSPWSMVIGKLMGSTAYTWYAGAICMLIYLVASANLREPGNYVYIAISYVLLAVIINAMSMITAIISCMNIGAKKKVPPSTPPALPILLAIFTMPFIHYAEFVREHTYELINWFTLELPPQDFIIISLTAYAAWAIIGCYRLMRTELSYRNGPWVWVAFQCFLLVYFSGVNYNSPQLANLDATLTFSFITSLAFTYILAFDRSAGFVNYRRLSLALKEKNITEVLESMPTWSISLVITLLITAAIVLKLTMTGSYLLAQWGIVSVLALLLFMARDIGLKLFLGMSDSSDKHEAWTLFWLIMAYGLVPMILRAAELKGILFVFWPLSGGSSLAALVAGTIEAAFILALAWRRWQLRLTEIKSAG